MSTLLQKSSLPLYVWIIVIVVGSVLVLGTIALIIRLIITRRRKAAFADTFGDDNLTRRVTVRRGRVVEQSKYLSLTGSRFGLNAFVTEDDLNSRAGARSKSPFEWWSTVKDRSQSRNSQVTQVTQITNDASSIYGPASPGLQRIYQRRDLNYSTTSLSSMTKDDEVSVSVKEDEPSSPPPLVRNFSRSFSRQGQHTPRLQTLSRIEESSPHTSMISTRQSRIASYASHRRDTKTDTPSPLPHSPTQPITFPQSSSKKSSVYQPHLPVSKKSSLYAENPEAKLQTPLPVAYNGSRSSLGEPEPRLSTVSSRNSLGSTKSRRQSHITALPEPPQPKQSDQYWDTRQDLHPIRTTSRKGKVLRKKSLTRRELVTRVDT